MTTWNPRANELFLKALELRGPGARQDYLDGVCGGDAALRAEVEALLDASARAGSFLEAPAAERLAEAPATPASPDATQGEAVEGGDDLAFLAPSDRSDSLGRLGHYEILGVIGRGGM